MTVREAAINTVAFVLLAIPGLAALFAGTFGMLVFIASGGRESPEIVFRFESTWASAAWSSVLFLAGSAMTLVGVRRERQPLYFLVFWMFPVGAVLIGLWLNGKSSPGLGGGLAALVTYWLV